MKNNVAVMTIDSDDNRVIMVVHSSHIYANKDGKHIGEIVASQFVPAKDVHVSEREAFLIVRAGFALRVALDNIHGVDLNLPHQSTTAAFDR